ncbi:30S ribosomal protein S30 [Skermanella stibiiresistens SB22]|uniref:30S ribosomal protein S30 n=1 Tax=Skermanella stibiiresistens SB22 TaxID=1385369 RepID=W9HDA6_9PROT|nr:HPF/RaiA family ribosome-associated protein [Skermanella stibiiresistens]EWY42701.1 30S ribosomal protein S30 [Skermanella stibiiresistens SB22]
MEVPLEIAFHNLDSSASLEARVRERVAKLEKLFPRLIACRVVIEAPHKQHQKGNIGRVRIEMSVPGNDLVVSKEPNRAREKFADPDILAVMKDAFDTAERMLKDHKGKISNDTKTHDTPMPGHIMRINARSDFGFLRSAEGTQLWFHRNSVMNEDLENFSEGDPVHYVEVMGETGPQASKVWRVTSEHQHVGQDGGGDEPA